MEEDSGGRTVGPGVEGPGGSLWTRAGELRVEG